MPRFPVLRSGAALAAALLCACTVSPHGPVSAAPAPAGTDARMDAARHLLRQLAARRRHFFATGDLREVFSVFYWHVTAAILQRVQNRTVGEPDLILEMLVNFYATYDRNRSAVRREPHWQPYYTLAAAAAPPDFRTGRKLIQRGIAAHIDHDLRQLLTQLLQRHPELRGARLRSLEEALDSLNDLFLPCSVAGFNDLGAVLPDAPGPRGIVMQSRMARAIIRYKRHRAWVRAVSTLDQGSPQ